MKLLLPAALVPLPFFLAAADEPKAKFRAGETYEIILVRDSARQGPNGSTGSSHDQDAIIERIEAVRPDGLQAVFDFPRGASAESRQQTWQFPAQVFFPREGPAKLLNASELGRRVNEWLSRYKMTREACGHWFFTWNAFRVECDPQTVIDTVRVFDPELPELREAALYQDAYAAAPAPLTKKPATSTVSTFAATLAIDPQAVQRNRAQADVVVGEISRQPITLEAALAAHAKDAVSGTIEVSIDADGSGKWTQLTKVTKTQTKKADGTIESETTTQTLRRRLIEPKS